MQHTYHLFCSWLAVAGGRRREGPPGMGIMIRFVAHSGARGAVPNEPDCCLPSARGGVVSASSRRRATLAPFSTVVVTSHAVSLAVCVVWARARSRAAKPAAMPGPVDADGRSASGTRGVGAPDGLGMTVGAEGSRASHLAGALRAVCARCGLTVAARALERKPQAV